MEQRHNLAREESVEPPRRAHMTPLSFVYRTCSSTVDRSYHNGNFERLSACNDGRRRVAPPGLPDRLADLVAKLTDICKIHKLEKDDFQ